MPVIADGAGGGEDTTTGGEEGIEAGSFGTSLAVSSFSGASPAPPKGVKVGSVDEEDEDIVGSGAVAAESFLLWAKLSVDCVLFTAASFTAIRHARMKARTIKILSRCREKSCFDISLLYRDV